MKATASNIARSKPADSLDLQQLLRLLDRPIAFHRCFVKPTGSITAALMLSQALYWQQRTKDPEGWWYKTREEWREETGMSRWEQEEARKRLRRVGVVREERRGIPARLWYRVDEVRLLELLGQPDSPIEPETGPEGLTPATTQGEESSPTGGLEALQPDGGKPTNWLGTPLPTITETTAETTTETTTTTPNPSSSTERAPATERVCDRRGVEDQNPEPQDNGREIATLETTEEKTVSQEVAQTAATTEENSDTPIENQNPVASEAAIEAQPLELALPAKLTEREQEDITAQVDTLPPDIAQQMLDVVEAKRRSGQIRINPAAMLRGIVRKYRQDPASFDPSVGFTIADIRRRRAEEEARARAEVMQRAQAREASPITPQSREVAQRSLAAIKQLLRGRA